MKKKILLTVLSAIMAISSFAGCGSAGSSGGNSSPNKPVENDVLLDITPVVNDGYLKLSVENFNGLTTEGYGCQLDTHMFKESYNNFYGEEEMAEWFARVDDMELQSIRTQIFPEWYERGNDDGDYNSFNYNSANVDMDSIEMQQLYRLLDICEERDIKVDLTFMGCHRFYESQDGEIKGSWLANTFSDNWITSPKLQDESGKSFAGYEEYAESVYAVLNHLVNVKKYTCIYVFSLFPEPNISFLDKNGYSDDAEYIKFSKVVKNKLIKEGLWEKVTMAGPGDCANDIDKYKGYIGGLKDVCLTNTSSVYKFNEQNTNKEMYDYALERVKACAAVGCTWGVCESGSNRFIDPANQSDVDTYDRAVFLARTVINYTNAGCTNMKYWVLNDVNYGGYIMRLGLWKEIGEKYNAEARPQFYSWSLITKYTEFGSEIYPVTSSDDDVCMVAYRLPGGEWTYMVASTAKTTKKICITSRHSTAQKQMKVYELSGATVPSTNRTITSSKTVEMQNGSLHLTVRANSFTVISNK